MLGGIVKLHAGDTLNVFHLLLDFKGGVIGDVGNHNVGRAVGDKVVIHHGQALPGFRCVGQVGCNIVLNLDPAGGNGAENQRKYV